MGYTLDYLISCSYLLQDHHFESSDLFCIIPVIFILEVYFVQLISYEGLDLTTSGLFQK